MVTRAEKLTIWIQFEITRPVAAIKSLRFALLFFKVTFSHFQALFWENISFSRQNEKSSTFQDSSQIQALFKVCVYFGMLSTWTIWTCFSYHGGCLKNAYELLNLRDLKISTLHKNCIFHCHWLGANLESALHHLKKFAWGSNLACCFKCFLRLCTSWGRY